MNKENIIELLHKIDGIRSCVCIVIFIISMAFLVDLFTKERTPAWIRAIVFVVLLACSIALVYISALSLEVERQIRLL